MQTPNIVQAPAVGQSTNLVTVLAAVAEERGEDLDPDLAALGEALFSSRNAPPGTLDVPRLRDTEGSGAEEDGLRGKPLCASVAGFSLPRRDSCRHTTAKP